MSHSIVVCADCGEANTAVEWGFVLLAREGWTAQLGDNGRDPEWRCPACNAKHSDLETWDGSMNDAPAQRPRLRVLLVDDQVMVLRATASMLREFDVVTTGSAAEALGKLARGSHFDAVVSDVTMPGMGGPELFVRIRERHPHLAERVLLVSGDAYAAERMCSAVARRERISNMPRILHKPVPRDELVRAIEDVGQRRVGRSGTFTIEHDSQRLRANTK